MKGATELGMRWRIKAETLPTVRQPAEPVPPERALASAAACPMNDSVPYNSRCVAFLTGTDQPVRPH